MDVRLAEIVEQLGGELIGPPDLPLAGLASLASAGLAHIGFVTGERHREAMRASRAGALIVPPTLAEEAAQLGLVKAVVPPEELLPTALAYAEDLARNCSPTSMAVIKSQLYGDAHDPVAEVSGRAEKLMHESMVRPDLIEGITAFFEKRPPNFPALQER